MQRPVLNVGGTPRRLFHCFALLALLSLVSLPTLLLPLLTPFLMLEPVVLQECSRPLEPN